MPEEKYNPLKSPYHPLKHLAALRKLDKDEIPVKIIHSDSLDNRFKVRGGWWVGVKVDLHNAIKEELISDQIIKDEIVEFIKNVEKLRFGDNSLASRRTAKEIKWANEFIDTVLEQTGYANILLDLSLLQNNSK